jgi:hypothetical protein
LSLYQVVDLSFLNLAPFLFFPGLSPCFSALLV